MRARLVLGGLAALMAATAPAAGLTPAEQALFDRLPESVQRYCVPDTQPASSLATAALICDTPTSTGVIAKYASFASFQDLMTAYLAVSALMTGRAETDYGSCSDGAPPGERITRSQAADGLPIGRWTCYLRGGEAGLLWTRANVPVLSWAKRPDSRFPELLSWQALAYPSGPSVVVQSVEDALERQLLLRISPQVAAGNCVRIARPAGAAWNAGIRCDRLGGGDVTYRRYTESDDAQKDYFRTLESLRITVRAGGACTGPKPTERVYPTARAPRGRFACSTDARGRARLDWVDFRRGVHGVVRVPGASQAAVLGWWRGHPR